MQKNDVQNKKKKTLHFIIRKQVHSSIFTPPKHCNNFNKFIVQSLHLPGIATTKLKMKKKNAREENARG
jgi:hypothetical protein